MKKVLISFLVAGMLGATSCTDVFEPTIDYGNQTYINDYSALVTAVNDLNKSLSERFEALNTLLDKKLADIKLSIDENTGAIKVLEESMEDGLSTINTTLFDGFTALGTKMDANGNTIATAINEQGDILKAAIEANGNVVSTQIKDFKDAYASAEAANLAKMAEIVTAINDLTTANNTNSANLVTKLEQLLSDNGIYVDENNSEQMYMKPENFATIQDAGPTSSIYKLYADQLTTLPVTFTSKQVVSNDGTTHEHAIFTPETAKDAAPVLVATKAEVVEGVANGKKVVRVVKTAVNRNFKITISSSCFAKNIFGLRLTDANGTNNTTFTPVTSHSFTLLVYNKSTSVIENNVNAIVYCCSGNSTYPLVDPK